MLFSSTAKNRVIRNTVFNVPLYSIESLVSHDKILSIYKYIRIHECVDAYSQEFLQKKKRKALIAFM